LQQWQMECSGLPCMGCSPHQHYTPRQQPSLQKIRWPSNEGLRTPDKSCCGIVLDLASNVSTAASTPEMPSASSPPGLALTPPPGLEHIVPSPMTQRLSLEELLQDDVAESFAVCLGLQDMVSDIDSLDSDTSMKPSSTLEKQPNVQRDISLEELLQDGAAESFPVSLVLQDIVSDMDSFDSDTPMKPALTLEKKPNVTISLSDQLGISSIGSVGHSTGSCKPCAWVWKDGCRHAANCQYCHLCPPGELKRRKKDKTAHSKMTRVMKLT